MARSTPMMEQYNAIKAKNRDAVLLFRLGDFYEMFEQDALEASRILHITLTRRNGTPMCGFPYHASQTYISRLLKAGKKIAICEQTEDPAQAKGIVKREVVEVISPGIITNPDLLDDNDFNAIAALYGSPGRRLAVACLDVSTGDFVVGAVRGADPAEPLLNELEDCGVRELLYPEPQGGDPAFSGLLEGLRSARPDLVLRPADELLFSPLQAEQRLREQYGVPDSGVMELPGEEERIACGALLGYVRENVGQELGHLKWIRERRDDVLFVDNTTKRHLELTENAEGQEEATLLSVLDRTVTAMGRRLLKGALNSPSRDQDLIRERLGRVGALYGDPGLLEGLRDTLRGILDIERILSKITVGKGNARDLVGLKDSLNLAGALAGLLGGHEVLGGEAGRLPGFEELAGLLGRAVVDDPPPGVREGGFIRSGYSEELDALRSAGRENREWINRYQAAEQQRLGIGSLKVRYNRVIGYFIEVTKPNLHLVPGHYVKKQTLVGTERFTTQELQEHETLLAEARERGDALEYRLFEELRAAVLERGEELYRASGVIARLDLYASLALAARENGYVRPEITVEKRVYIRDGRHPVVELLAEEEFIGNDLDMDGEQRRVMILTGPNMSGKSTYLRQNALIVIMAHMGSFVPASEARIGLVDRVFSRIGASDRLVKGQSTFLVEMIETARILHYATDRSFIIMDEIGRGTSTYDGLAIAWAVLEYLLDVQRSGAKVLFATHYHEITALQEPGVVICNVTVKEWNNRILFLRKVVPGSASRSYG
ncbi:MAG: DNA mismatch repair protein MutS, partial [Spirochaetota bacterium]